MNDGQHGINQGSFDLKASNEGLPIDPWQRLDFVATKLSVHLGGKFIFKYKILTKFEILGPEQQHLEVPLSRDPVAQWLLHVARTVTYSLRMLPRTVRVYSAIYDSAVTGRRF
jgi:hypothetical protein